ncbi:DUF3891 family protein [Alkalihalobacterium elongatum]|uniref:DUF3891 family protein n=1 Tax=Alkalihalobacterium elongatum TaxID=2675466 RepID=UPI001C1F505B|nr:DUF3891 family protein [Alkalihalobacterium elongatum]
MIFRETKDAFLMIKQHDHAYISGKVVEYFTRDLLQSDIFFQDTIYAAYEHDRSWVGLDETPIWNDQVHVPYSFSDFPLIPKLAFYNIGIDEVEKVNPYASLLCSLHYCSFFSRSTDEQVIKFLNKERKRQTNIKNNLINLNHELLLEHFRLLQFSDDLSLYICLNEPGVSKAEEHPWFVNGFANSEIFTKDKKPLVANWLNQNEIKLNSFPFYEEFQLTLSYKTVLKSAIQVMGIAKAYENSIVEEQQILVRK